MEKLKNFIFVFSCTVALTALLLHAQSQSGFISIDCGIPENSGYTDKKTGINYTSDANFIETGVRKKISIEYNSPALEQQFLNVRSFPEGTRNCYTLKLPHGNKKFLIRARFMYGNYDCQRKPPRFVLLLEADVWDSVEFEDASTIVSKEVIHIPQKDYVYVCLANTGSGTPFISALELRSLINSSYTTQSGSLLLFWRWDVGSTTNETIRYEDDGYDRIWSPYNRHDWVPMTLSRSLTVVSLTDNKPPSNVCRTAVRPANGGNSLQFGWKPSDPSFQYYAYFYFAEVEQLQAHQTRELYIYLNGRVWYGPIVPQYLYATTFMSTSPMHEENMEFSINKTENSTLPPILNGFEVHRLKEFSQLLTNQQDVDAIMNIKSKYGVKRNWQGDPCAPKDYLWQGLNCSYNDYDPPKITSLNLSSSGLAGEICPYISGLTSIESLDLSNNSLTGTVPEFLLQLPFLTSLNLTGNKLKGSIPTGLMERNKTGFLSLSVDRNPDLCREASCREKNKLMIPVAVVPVVAVVILFCVLLTTMAALWNLKTRRKLGKTDSSLELKSRRFSYSDVMRITNNFERVIGEGGFGTVYHGYLDDTQVAVKMLSPSSVQGYKQFKAEVELLMRVHHKNLTSLVGYCDERTNMGLIYEYMASGNLQAHLFEDDADLLSWEGRLRIATEAAQGLDYLHRGCKPPIVHRDVKSTNILLNENFQAKLADFGLSRVFPVEGRTHVSTIIAGTPGYLDPEYYISNRLTEKSDVYSFGVVLLEIITSKPAIEKSAEKTHISEWVSFKLAKADIRNIVDRRLQGDFDINSVWKAVEIAMACVSLTSAKRPTMNQVVIELNESLAIEIARKKVGKDNVSNDFGESISLVMSTELSPQVR
ncbi:protein kinase family protein [Melia azedarach]|uniref:Protein kinase family protein n=1 Tax=Melia azedarach TaxID=155640 RepID=A0ACC1Y4M1_MELAZ|nr:protein kinase family protein [Melia azedarach]